MPRPLWKGHISFGLVNVPVTLFSAESRSDLHFVLMDSRNKARIRYSRVNEATGQEVPWDRIVKGFEYDENSYVLLQDEDFERADVEATQTIDIEDFVDRESIDPRFFERPYYLTPDKKGVRPYVLLREVLKSKDKVGIGKVVIRSRQHLAALIPYEDAIILNLLRFKQEVRALDEYNFPSQGLSELKLTTKEMALAEKLVESLTVEWDPDNYHDEYREALLKWIEQKVQKGDAADRVEPKPEGAISDEGKVINLMDLLKKSVEGGDSAGIKSKAAKAPAKKAPGKRSGPAKKAPAAKKKAAPKRKTA